MIKKTNAIWITGAGSGIGKAVAAEFCKQKKYVIASARNGKALLEVKDILKEFGNYFIPFPLDVSKRNLLEKKLSKLSQNSFIKTLVNNAGITSFNHAENENFENIERIIKVNLLGAIFAAKLVLPEMIKRRKGTIINILSVASKKIFTQSSVYSASKAGLEAYMNVLREEVRKYNIKVINIFPGATKTAIWPDEMLEQFSKRMMLPEDIAEFIFSLYSSNTSIVPEEVVLRPIQGDSQ